MTAGPKALSNKDMGGLKVTNMADGTATTDAATKQQVDAAAAFGASLANRGTSTTDHTAINDFDTQVRTSRLDQMAAPTASVGLNSQKLINVLDPTLAQDAATKNYVDSQLSAQASGLVLKGSVRAATSTNITLATPGTTIDSLTAVAGEIFLLMGQTTASQNGPYVFNGSAAAMTRATNWDTSAEAVLGSFWDVREGTNADTFALCTNDTAITLGTTALTFVIRGQAATGTTGFTVTCPATSAGGTWTVTHNLNSKFVIAQVARVASPFDIVDVRIERFDAMNLRVLPDIALALGEYEIMVQKVA